MTVADAAHARRLSNLIGYVVKFALAGGALYIGAGLWIGFAPLVDAVARIGVPAVVAGLVASLTNYLLRFARWHLMLGRLGHAVPMWEDLRIYLSGLALTTTPGKIGETLRSALLHRHGVPVGESLAAFFVDRLSDLVGVLLLAAATAPNAAAGSLYAAVAAAVIALASGLRYLAAHPGARRATVRALHRIRLHWLAAWVDHGTAGFLRLWTPGRAALYAAFGMAAYGLQAIAFSGFVAQVWPAIDVRSSTHIFLVATLAGAASMVPGGLGTMELAAVGLLAVEGVPVAIGTPLAITIRAVTLWFGILVGLFCLRTFRRGAGAPAAGGA